MTKNQNPVINRSTEEYIILTLSGCSSVCILPFALYRLAHQDWAVATLDVFLVLAMSSLFAYVFHTRATAIPALIMALVSLATVFTTIVLKGVDQLLWLYPALTVSFFLIPPRTAALLSTILLVSLGVVIQDRLSVFLALELYISATATLVFSYVFADRMRKQQQQLKELATLDPLTGAGNRRAMEQSLLDIITMQRRDSSRPATLILMDLDKFKIINDSLGHAKGDDMLKTFAQCVQNRIRQSDKLYRFGGEEFIVVAQNTPLRDGIMLAEQLRQCVEENPQMAAHNLTISVGTAKYHPNETAYEWIGRADKAMYQAKDMGRNHCCVA